MRVGDYCSYRHTIIIPPARQQFTHSLTHSLAHSLTHSLSPLCSFAHPSLSHAVLIYVLFTDLPPSEITAHPAVSLQWCSHLFHCSTKSMIADERAATLDELMHWGTWDIRKGE